MQVGLISYTPNAELTIAAADRVSSSTTQATDFLAKLTPKQVSDLLGRLISAGHLSPFEHASFTLGDYSIV